MPVRLNITLEEGLYRHLKARAPSKKMSAFIAEALQLRFGPGQRDLELAYQAASQEPWRRRLADEWGATETEAWPD